MPPKQTRSFLITLRPRGGINDLEVGIFEGWVGERVKLFEKYAIVLEKTGSSRHLHCVLVYHKETNQSNIKKALYLQFAQQIANEANWDTPKIAFDVKAHHDPDGCVGGYLEKEDAHTVRSCVGFNLEGLQAGRDRRNEAIHKRKLRECNRQNLLYLMYEAHAELWKINSAYRMLMPNKQVPACFKEVLRMGYINYALIWTPTLRSTVIDNWRDILYPQLPDN